MDFKNLKPWLNSTDSKYLEDALRNCKEYLEFGSGGSTLLADQICPTVVTVETDKRFINGLLPYCRRTKFVFVDLGDIRKEGKPKSEKPPGLFYYRAPWKYVTSPDLIFVDGRFRVATLCYTLIHTKPGTRILFDDILKPQYEVLRKLPVPFKMISKMCEFISPEIKYHKLTECICEYEFDWR